MSTSEADDFARQLEELVKEYSTDAGTVEGDTVRQEEPATYGKAAVEAAVEVTDGSERIEASGQDIAEALRRLDSQLVELAGLKPLFGAMHAELKTYKDDFLFDSLQRPVIMDLIAFQDDLRAVANQFEPGGKGARKSLKASHNLDNCLAFLAEILGRLGVEELTACEGPFDPTWQRAIRTVELGGTIEDGAVAEVVRSGFRWRGRILRPVDVVVGRARRA